MAPDELTVEQERDALKDEVHRLRVRLAAAEQVCTLFGWTAAHSRTDREKAASQAWHDWVGAYGSPSPSPEWNERVSQLARRRDEIRTQTLARIAGDLYPAKGELIP